MAAPAVGGRAVGVALASWQPLGTSDEEALRRAIAASLQPSEEEEALAAAVSASLQDAQISPAASSKRLSSDNASPSSAAGSARKRIRRKSAAAAAAAPAGSGVGGDDVVMEVDSSPSPQLAAPASAAAAAAEAAAAAAEDGASPCGQSQEGWLVVADFIVRPSGDELKWLTERVQDNKIDDINQIKDGAFTTAVYTYAKRNVYLPNDGYETVNERTQPTTFRFGDMPEVENDWSNVSQASWLHTPGLRASEENFNFQRLRVVPQGSDLWAGLQVALGMRTKEFRVIIEWNPYLAMLHLASKFGFHAANLRFACRLAPVQPPGWRPPSQDELFGEAAAEHEFFLRGCAGEAPACQPPRFKRWPLRPEQLRSLRWMQDREARPASFATEVESRFVPGVEWDSQPEHWKQWMDLKSPEYWEGFESRSGFRWCYEAKLKADMRVAGGVLGDAIGSGKTATLIGLLDSQRSKKGRPPPPMHDARHLVPCRATLILVPSNLLGQWEGEFKKFLGPDAFKFLIVRSIADLKRLSVAELTKYEVVLATYKVLYSQDYIARLRSLQCTRENCLHERSFLGQPIEHTLAEVQKAEAAVLAGSAGAVGWTMRAKTNKEQEADRMVEVDNKRPLSPEEVEARIQKLGLCRDWRKLTLPVFELFLWHRIVFDEFHELEAMDKRRRCMLENLQSRYRWGLTGTPPKRDMQQITQLARMLRIHLRDEDHCQCQHFLDVFARQNFSELPEIPVKEHVIFVQHTLEERVLYLQQEFDGNRRNLLQFCSHHCLRGSEDQEEQRAETSCGGSSAKTSVLRLGERKHQEQAKRKSAVLVEYQILVALACGAKEGHKDGKAEAEAASKLLQLEAEASNCGSSDLRGFVGSLPRASAGPGLVRTALDAMDRSHSGSSTVADVLRAINRSAPPSLQQLRSARAVQLGRCAAALAKLLSATRSLCFFETTLSVLRGADGGSEAPECPVCLDPMTPETAAVLPCAHAFHMGCVLHLLASGSQACPTCRAPFKKSDAASLENPTIGGSTGVSEEVERFGSKLARIGETLREIQRKDPKAKAIVFVQWKQLEALVGEALEEMGIDHVRLKGAALQRSRLIAAFQEQPEPRVLLQSLENSASGANLTRASHVLLVHPMDADSRERAVAYEMQALGRVRRCGQTAKRVHLYRYVTRGTVEEDITREHQLGVAEGIRAAGSGSGSAGSAASSAAVGGS